MKIAIASSQPMNSDSIVPALPRSAKKPKITVKMLMKIPNCHA